LQKRATVAILVFVDMEIMKTFTSRSRVLCTAGSLLVASTSGLFAADLVLQKVPPLTVAQTPGYPVNLARTNLGAHVDSLAASSGADADKATALLSADPSSSYVLPTGTTTLLVALPQIENVGSIAFLNDGAKGSVSVAMSNAKLPAESRQWRNAAQQELATDRIDAKVGPGEAKYVRLTFNVTQPGKISGFGIYSTPQVSDFTKPRSSSTAADEKTGSFGLISYNQADIHSKARALYVSSGSDVKQANNIIDDQPSTSYTFSSADGSPTTVIDLGKASSVRRLSAVYSARPGKMAFYVMQSLPKTEGAAPQMLTIDDATFSGMTPVASFEDDGSKGRGSVEFPQTTGRYVMARWTPAAQADTSFTLAEVAVLGAQGGTLLAQNTTADPSSAADETQSADTTAGTTDGKTMLDGKTMIDGKDLAPVGEGPLEPVGEGPDGPPPSLPPPPPFTFIPVIAPFSA
jgi:hypothetical protein